MASKRKEQGGGPSGDGPVKKRPRLLKDVTGEVSGGSVEGRVKSKLIRKFGADGPFRLSFVVVDETAELTVVLIGQGAESLHETLVIGECYRITSFKTKEVKLDGRMINEIHLSKLSQVEVVANSGQPALRIEKRKLDSLLECGNQEIVTIAGVVYKVEEPISSVCYDRVRRSRQVVDVVDDTMKIVSVTLWKDHLRKLDGAEGQAVVFQDVVTNSFMGKRTLSATYASIIHKDGLKDDVDRVELQKWFDAGAIEYEFEALKLLNPVESPSVSPEKVAAEQPDPI